MNNSDEILITGGCGFLGVRLARRLLQTDEESSLILADVTEHPRRKVLGDRARMETVDLSDPATCRELITPRTRTVFHLASLVSGGAEQDFDAGMAANLDATRHLLDACRQAGHTPRFVFTSSIAVFGGVDLPEEVTDGTALHPQTSYGMQKAAGELLLNEYTRRGFIDGRGVRLPAVIVRDEPNTAASGYASALIREPLAGRDYVCPVAPDDRIPVMGVRCAVQLLLALSRIDGKLLGDWRTLNAPGMSPSAAEIADAVRGFSGRVPVGQVGFSPDPEIRRIISGWPRVMRAERADQLNLPRDRNVTSVIENYLQEKAGRPRAEAQSQS